MEMNKIIFNIIIFLCCFIPTCLFILLMGYLITVCQDVLGMRKDVSIILYWFITTFVIYKVGKDNIGNG